MDLWSQPHKFEIANTKLMSIKRHYSKVYSLFDWHLQFNHEKNGWFLIAYVHPYNS